MRVAILSGKGGTGKTTVSTNLANIVGNTILVDCDVEEPNSHLFFSIDNRKDEPVYTEYPDVDADKCTLCGECGRVCQFNAILPAKNRVLIFKESCHDCGGCKIVCPTGAISYKKRVIGFIKAGITQKGFQLQYGDLNVGELSGVKVIEELLERVKDKDVIIDSPPGTSCATVAAVESANYAIVVSEPTPFGVSDMKMVVEMLESLKIPFGLVINKAGLGNNEIYDYAKSKKIAILGEIPFSREVAEINAKGGLVTDFIPDVHDIFQTILSKLNGTLTEKFGVKYGEV